MGRMSAKSRLAHSSRGYWRFKRFLKKLKTTPSLRWWRKPLSPSLKLSLIDRPFISGELELTRGFGDPSFRTIDNSLSEALLIQISSGTHEKLKLRKYRVISSSSISIGGKLSSGMSLIFSSRWTLSPKMPLVPFVWKNGLRQAGRRRVSIDFDEVFEAHWCVTPRFFERSALRRKASRFLGRRKEGLCQNQRVHAWSFQ